jgi:hypothetical protein
VCRLPLPEQKVVAAVKEWMNLLREPTPKQILAALRIITDFGLKLWIKTSENHHTMVKQGPVYALSIRRRSIAWTILLDSTYRSRRRASALWMTQAKSFGRRR